MQLQENTLVADRFRLIRMIGRGGMGSVWHAFDTRLDNACALKFIEGELANVADAHARFQREAKAAAALRSPHVVEIKDHGVWQGSPYIAMELLEGEDLGKALTKAGGRLPPAQVNTVIQQVCRALHKAHAAGIVHRDLKPDNIFLVTDDDRQLVKILDFGVAKQTSQAIDGSNTKTGAMLGTPYYMSPEQAQGIKSVDARSDLWSLAVIVYQCITGRLPFESEALGDLLVKIIVQPVPVPSQVASVPPAFDRWWAKAAERNPDHRFATAKEFAQQLEIALGGMSVTEVGMSAPVLQGTAVMNPNTPFQNTPNPHAGSQGPQFGTPHPGVPTPQGMVMGSSSSGVLGASGNPVTFSDPALPKKGPPVALLAAFAALLVIGLAGAGVVVAKRSSSASAHAPPPPSAVTAAPAESVAPVAKVDTPPQVPTAEASAAASADPVAASASAAPKAHTTSTTSTKTAATAAAAPKSTAAPAASVKKRKPVDDLGF
jgi:serine/threonine-protein kinase